MEIMKNHFSNPDEILEIIYKAGGLTPGCYGYTSRGYGGGIDQDEYFKILWLQGYFQALVSYAKTESIVLFRDINEELKNKYEDVNEGNQPFKAS